MKTKLLSFLLLFFSFGVQAQVRSFSDFLEYHDAVKKYWLDENESMRLKPQFDGDLYSPHDNENPNLFTGEYFFLVKKNGWMKGHIKTEFEGWAKRIVDQISILDRNGRVVEGLYNRRPGFFKRHFSRDEQFGLTYMDYALDFELRTCLALREYGTQNQWRFDNRTFEGRVGYDSQGRQTTPDEDFVISLRQPEFIEYIRLCSGRPSDRIGRWNMIAALTVTASRPRNLTTGKIMAVLRLESLEGRLPRDLQAAKKVFYLRLKEQYGENFLHEMFKIYFGPHHPMVVMSQFLQL